MSENKFLTYKNKPLVRNKNDIYYGDMKEPYIVKFNILSTKKDGSSEIPDKVSVQLLKSEAQVNDKDRIVKETVRDSLFDALDFGFVWLERALKTV